MTSAGLQNRDGHPTIVVDMSVVRVGKCVVGREVESNSVVTLISLFKLLRSDNAISDRISETIDLTLNNQKR